MANEHETVKSKWVEIILPGMLATILAAVLGATGWGVVEYWSSYKEFIRSEIKIADLNSKLREKEIEARTLDEKNNLLTQSLRKTTENLSTAEKEIEKLSSRNKKLNSLTNETADFRKKYESTKKSLATAQADNSSLKRKLADLKRSNEKLNKLVNDKKLMLSNCTNRVVGATSISGNYKKWSEMSYGRPVSSVGVTTLLSGRAWITVDHIGQDNNGNFAMVRSSLFNDTSAMYCVRVGDAFLIHGEIYFGVYSIDEVLMFEYYKK